MALMCKSILWIYKYMCVAICTLLYYALIFIYLSTV